MGKPKKDNRTAEAPMSRCFDKANAFDTLISLDEAKRQRERDGYRATIRALRKGANRGKA